MGARAVGVVAGMLDAHPEAAVAGPAARVFGNRSGVFYPRYPAGAPRDVFDAVFETWILLPTASVMRRDAVLAVGGYDERVRRVNDYDLHLRLAHRYPFVCTHRVTAGWRRHDTQISSSLHQQYVDLYECRERFIRAIGVAQGAEAERALEHRAARVWRQDVRVARESRGFQRLDALRVASRHVAALSVRDRLRWWVLCAARPMVTHGWDRLPLRVRRVVCTSGP